MGFGEKLVEQTTKIGSGSTPKGGKEVYIAAGIPFIRSLNVLHYEFQEDELSRIPAHIDSSMAGTRVLPGDVLLNITGASIGRSCVIPQEICPANVSQHVAILRASYPRIIGFPFSNVLVEGLFRIQGENRIIGHF